MRFCDRMTRAMEAQGVTAATLAKEVGVCPLAIRRIASGDSRGTDRNRWKIAQALEIPMEEVFPEEESMTIGKWARLHRLRAGLTAYELADKAKVTQPVVWSIENDARGTNIFSIIQIADALGIGIDEYIGRRVKHDRE